MMTCFSRERSETLGSRFGITSTNGNSAVLEKSYSLLAMHILALAAARCNSASCNKIESVPCARSLSFENEHTTLASALVFRLPSCGHANDECIHIITHPRANLGITPNSMRKMLLARRAAHCRLRQIIHPRDCFHLFLSCIFTRNAALCAWVFSCLLRQLRRGMNSCPAIKFPPTHQPRAIKQKVKRSRKIVSICAFIRYRSNRFLSSIKILCNACCR